MSLRHQLCQWLPFVAATFLLQNVPKRPSPLGGKMPTPAGQPWGADASEGGSCQLDIGLFFWCACADYLNTKSCISRHIPHYINVCLLSTLSRTVLSHWFWLCSKAVEQKVTVEYFRILSTNTIQISAHFPTIWSNIVLSLTRWEVHALMHWELARTFLP